MTLNQILYFQKIANLENYHQAAEELYIITAIPEPVNGSVYALLHRLQIFRQLGRINHQTEFKPAPVKILVIHLQMNAYIKKSPAS